MGRIYSMFDCLQGTLNVAKLFKIHNQPFSMDVAAIIVASVLPSSKEPEISETELKQAFQIMKDLAKLDFRFKDYPFQQIEGKIRTLMAKSGVKALPRPVDAFRSC